MPARKLPGGRLRYHGRTYTPRQWRAKWVTKGFARPPKRKKGRSRGKA